MGMKPSRLIAVAAILMAGSAVRLPAAEAPTSGTISVELGAVAQDVGPSVPAFVEAVGKVLADKGFTVIEGAGHARLVADIRLSRVEVGTGTTKVPVAKSSIAPGGSPSRAGGGITVSLPTGKSRTVALQQTRLEICVKKQGEDNVIWHGAAITVRAADTREGQDAAVSSALAEAILRGYPTQSDDVVSIP